MSLKIKKILLIHPFTIETDSYDYDVVVSGGQFAESPLGLGYIASYVQRYIDGLEIKILDANLMAIKHIISEGSCNMAECWDLLRNKIKEFSPDIAGISCLFHSTSSIAHRTCSVVKEVSPDAITVTGGSYSTISYSEVLENSDIDFAIIGEGEVCFADLICACNGEKEFSDLDGIAYRSDQDIVYRENKFVISNLDELPFPCRVNISPNDYIMPNNFSEYGNLSRNFLFRVLDRNKAKTAVVTASRGCPYSCTFCSAKHLWGRTIRYRSPANVADEIESLVCNYGVNTIVFNDDNFTVNKRRTTAILDEIIKRKLNINWGAGGGLGVNSLTEEMIAKMYESGISIFNLAFESGSKKTLKKIGKALKLETSRQVVNKIRQLGDGYIIGFFISGFHFETEEDVEQTIDFARSLDLDWALIRNYQAIPGSRIYEECLEKGYLPRTKIKYGYPLLTSSVIWPNFSKEFILETNYLANLEINFLNSRNLRPDRVDQAIKDFKWVIELVPNHAMAYYALGKAYKIKGQMHKAENAWKKTQQLLLADNDFKKYFIHFKIDLNKELNQLYVSGLLG